MCSGDCSTWGQSCAQTPCPASNCLGELQKGNSEKNEDYSNLVLWQSKNLCPGSSSFGDFSLPRDDPFGNIWLQVPCRVSQAESAQCLGQNEHSADFIFPFSLLFFSPQMWIWPFLFSVGSIQGGFAAALSPPAALSLLQWCKLELLIHRAPSSESRTLKHILWCLYQGRNSFSCWQKPSKQTLHQSSPARCFYWHGGRKSSSGSGSLCISAAPAKPHTALGVCVYALGTGGFSVPVLLISGI